MSRHTYNSVDEDNYSKISVTISPQSGCKMTRITCTSLTTNCHIRILNEHDSFSFTCNDKPHTVYFEDYTSLSAETFAELMNTRIEQYDLRITVDHCNRFIFSSKYPFQIDGMTYNVKLLLGLYSKKDSEINNLIGELSNNNYILKIKAVGFFLSTPILNLVCNFGDPIYHNTTDNIVDLQSCPSILRINNSFSPSVPIISTGDGTSTIIPSGYTSGSVFVLVDANNHQVDLLSPMYISLYIEPIPDNIIEER